MIFVGIDGILSVFMFPNAVKGLDISRHGPHWSHVSQMDCLCSSQRIYRRAMVAWSRRKGRRIVPKIADFAIIINGIEVVLSYSLCLLGAFLI